MRLLILSLVPEFNPGKDAERCYSDRDLTRHEPEFVRINRPIDMFSQCSYSQSAAKPRQACLFGGRPRRPIDI